MAVIVCVVCASSLLGCSALGLEGTDLPVVKASAPELDGGVGWLNTDRALHLRDLRGKIVLLDFWTFCCINCMHVIPDLKRLEEKYPDELVVIGVHSAKFDNEKDTNNIREAIARYGIKHPVVNDADLAIWRAYGVHAWPTLVLIDPDGSIAGQVSGEGNYDALDSAIAKLIAIFGNQDKLNRQPLSLVLEKTKMAETPLRFPGKIEADVAGGRLFVSDSGHNRIVVLSFAGKLLDVIGSGGEGAEDGDYAHAAFNHQQGLAYHGDQLFVADTQNHLLRHVDLKARLVTTVAGTGKQSGFAAGGGAALKTALSSPWDLVWVDGKIYIAMAGAHQIWVLDLKSQSVEPFAGSGREDIIDGPLRFAALAQPSGITTDGDKLYVADSEVSAIRMIGIMPDGQVRTVVGQGLFDFGDRDGVGKEVRLQHPLAVRWLDGKLYVADSYNHKIKIVDPLRKTATTFLGTGKPGLVDGKSPQFSEPGGLAFAGGTLYVADTNNQAIRAADLYSREVRTLSIEGLAPPAVGQ